MVLIGLMATKSHYLGKFPSPCGDYGSYLNEMAYIQAYIYKEFPSPCGDYGSYRNM